MDTGATLAFSRHDGTMGDVACSQPPPLTINGDLAGHRIQVRFTSQKRDAAASIRVYAIAFFQG